MHLTKRRKRGTANKIITVLLCCIFLSSDQRTLVIDNRLSFWNFLHIIGVVWSIHYSIFVLNVAVVGVVMGVVTI